MNKIKVAHILNSVGGVDVYLRLIVKNIDNSKVETIVIHGEDDTDKAYLDGFNKTIKNYKLPIQREIRIFKDISVILKTIKILKKEKPQLIHSHSAKGGVIGKTVGWVLNIPVLYTPHAYSYLSAESSFKRKLYLFIERCFRRTNNIILATSLSEQNRAINEVGYKKENTVLFNNSISPIELDPECSNISIHNLPKDYICTVGRPSYQKNIEMMIEVLVEVKKTIPNIHLVIMGIGVVSPNTDNVKRLIKEYGLESNTTLIEWIQRERVFHIVSQSKLYISTARYEGLPYAIIESLSLSKSIVATNCDGNRDLIKDGENGFLLKPNDVNLMSDKIIELIQDDTKRHEFEKKSLQIFNQEFNLNKNIKNLEEIYLKYSAK